MVTSQKIKIQNQLEIMKIGNIDKYLGCPVINGRVTKNTFIDTINKTRNQLTKWKANSLSQAGRTTLIKANLAMKPSFIMQNFMLPRSVHLEMDKINREFFWNKGTDYKPLIGWDDICKPYDKGGLGIRKTENMNKALQMKLLWKILSEPENIWVRIIQEKYLRNRSILQYSCKGDSS